MTPVKMSKADPKNAERAAEHFAVKILGCIKTVRAVQTQFQRQDMFGSDVIGKNKYGMSHYIQVTTGGKSAVQQRKKKMESYPWHSSDRVYVLQMLKFKSKSLIYKFKVLEYWPNETVPREWVDWAAFGTAPNDVKIDKSWFKAIEKPNRTLLK